MNDYLLSYILIIELLQFTFPPQLVDFKHPQKLLKMTKCGIYVGLLQIKKPKRLILRLLSGPDGTPFLIVS